MRLEIPNTCHHGDKDRIMSIDFHPFSNLFVTAGGDQDSQYQCDGSDSDTESQGYIKVWKYIYNAHTEQERILFISGLGGHKKDVNCVRFSNNGRFLASGSDDQTIKIWEIAVTTGVYMNKFSNKEKIFFKTIKDLIGHGEAIIDICWSNCSNYLVSGGMDKRAILWEIQKQQYMQIFDGHKSFVQGVIFDPLSQFVLTVGNDRVVKVWEQYKQKQNQKPSFIIKQINNKNKNKLFKMGITQRAEKLESVGILSTSVSQVKMNIFRWCEDQTGGIIIHHTIYSPDGSFFLLPACVYQKAEGEKTEFCVLGYCRIEPQKAVCVFKTENKPAICIRFCKKVYKREKEFSLFDLPYKIIFAIATIDMVIIYSTENDIPLGVIGNIHYALLTDLSWKDDDALAVSSSDGFISLCVFDKKELGEELKKDGTIYFYKFIDIADERLKEVLFKTDYYIENQDLYKNFGQVVNKNQQQVIVQNISRVEQGQDGKKRIIPSVIKK